MRVCVCVCIDVYIITGWRRLYVFTSTDFVITFTQARTKPRWNNTYLRARVYSFHGIPTRIDILPHTHIHTRAQRDVMFCIIRSQFHIYTLWFVCRATHLIACVNTLAIRTCSPLYPISHSRHGTCFTCAIKYQLVFIWEPNPSCWNPVKVGAIIFITNDLYFINWTQHVHWNAISLP